MKLVEVVKQKYGVGSEKATKWIHEAKESLSIGVRPNEDQKSQIMDFIGELAAAY